MLHAITVHNTHTSTCLDCGTPTFCNHAHGAGHDHSEAARACTRQALADGEPMIYTFNMATDALVAAHDRIAMSETREDEDNAWTHLELVRDSPLGAPISDDLRETLEVLGVID